MYNINICVYTACGEGKVELFEPVDDFDKNRKDVKILVWETMMKHVRRPIAL